MCSSASGIIRPAVTRGSARPSGQPPEDEELIEKRLRLEEEARQEALARVEMARRAEEMEEARQRREAALLLQRQQRRRQLEAERMAKASRDAEMAEQVAARRALQEERRRKEEEQDASSKLASQAGKAVRQERAKAARLAELRRVAEHAAVRNEVASLGLLPRPTLISPRSGEFVEGAVQEGSFAHVHEWMPEESASAASACRLGCRSANHLVTWQRSASPFLVDMTDAMMLTGGGGSGGGGADDEWYRGHSAAAVAAASSSLPFIWAEERSRLREELRSRGVTPSHARGLLRRATPAALSLASASGRSGSGGGGSCGAPSHSAGGECGCACGGAASPSAHALSQSSSPLHSPRWVASPRWAASPLPSPRSPDGRSAPPRWDMDSPERMHGTSTFHQLYGRVGAPLTTVYYAAEGGGGGGGGGDGGGGSGGMHGKEQGRSERECDAFFCSHGDGVWPPGLEAAQSRMSTPELARSAGGAVHGEVSPEPRWSNEAAGGGFFPSPPWSPRVPLLAPIAIAPSDPSLRMAIDTSSEASTHVPQAVPVHLPASPRSPRARFIIPEPIPSPAAAAACNDLASAAPAAALSVGLRAEGMHADTRARGNMDSSSLACTSQQAASGFTTKCTLRQAQFSAAGNTTGAGPGVQVELRAHSSRAHTSQRTSRQLLSIDSPSNSPARSSRHSHRSSALRSSLRSVSCGRGSISRSSSRDAPGGGGGSSKARGVRGTTTVSSLGGGFRASVIGIGPPPAAAGAEAHTLRGQSRTRTGRVLPSEAVDVPATASILPSGGGRGTFDWSSFERAAQTEGLRVSPSSMRKERAGGKSSHAKRRLAISLPDGIGISLTADGCVWVDSSGGRSLWNEATQRRLLGEDTD